MIHPDEHMFAQEDFHQAKPDVVISIMTQLSVKVGLKEWEDHAHTAVKSKMKQLPFRNNFIPMHHNYLTHK